MRGCETKALGLKGSQLAGLTGFSWPAVMALAHLRDAWLVADTGNRIAIEHALFDLVQESHSLRDIPETVKRVLTVGLDVGQSADILDAAGLLDPHSVHPTGGVFERPRLVFRCPACEREVRIAAEPGMPMLVHGCPQNVKHVPLEPVAAGGVA